MYSAERKLISNKEKSSIKLPQNVVIKLRKEGSESGPKHPNQVIAGFLGRNS